MTVVSVAFDGTRLSQAESETDGGTWDKWGSTQSPTQEVDWPYQLGASNAAISNKASKGEAGVDFDSTGTNDYTTGPKVVLAQVTLVTFGLLDTSIHGGLKYYIGSSGSDYYTYYIFGSKKAYDPPTGGWTTLAIDPNEVAYRAATQGTPALGSVDYYGVQATTTATVKSDNVGHDSLSYLTVGDGLTLTAGTSTDPDGVFQDFIDYDQGTVANRWNVCQSVQGALIVTGWLNIGTGAATEFTDSGAVVIWTESLTAEGFNGILFDLGTAATVISATDCFFQGKGRGFAKDFFDTTADIDATNDVITLDTSKDWQDLDYVVYSKEGGTGNIGLTVATDYWIAWDSTNSGWAVYTTRDNAATDTSRANLSTVASENHSFEKDPDTRPDMTSSGSTGTSVTLDGSSVDNFRNVTLTVDTSFQNGKFSNCDQIDCGTGADISGSTITGYNGEADTSAILWTPNLDPDGELDGITITKSDTAHHAIEFGTASPLTMTIRDWTTSGFNASNGQTDSTIHVKRTSGTVTINTPGGSGNFSYKTDGATVVVQNSVDLTVTVKDTGGTALVGVRVAIYTTPGGTELMNEDTVAGGIATQPYNYTSDQAIRIEIRESPNSPSGRYVPAQRTGTIEDTGFTLTVVLEDDTIAQVV
jgi:hypothetical protein